MGTTRARFQSTGSSYEPSLAVDADGNVHVAWHDYSWILSSGTDPDVFYKNFTVSTGRWSDVELVSAESTGQSFSPSLAVDAAGALHVAWRDQTDHEGAGTDYDVFYRNRTAGGGWGSLVVVTAESTLDCQKPSLAVDSSGTSHLVWHDSTPLNGSGSDADVYYRNVTSSGALGPLLLLTPESGSSSFYPKLALDETAGVTVHVAWYDYSPTNGSSTEPDVFYRNVTAWDGSLGPLTLISTESTGNSQEVALAEGGGGDLHFAWRDYTDLQGCGADPDVFYAAFSPSTGSLQPLEVASTESTDESVGPSLAVDPSGVVHLAWVDKTDHAGAGTDQDVFYKARLHVPDAPVLSPISPNPDADGAVSLDWNDVPGAASYEVYRHGSFITEVNCSLALVATTVLVALPSNPPAAPVLAPISPNPDADGNVTLDWSEVPGATSHEVYRHDAFISVVNVSLTLAGSPATGGFTDVGLENGTCYYAVVAINASGKSGHSNCEPVVVAIPGPADGGDGAGGDGGGSPTGWVVVGVVVAVAAAAVAALFFGVRVRRTRSLA
ncbi:MAG: hypothetical protein Kow0069_38460 [Promethearchaeota archaeon]